MHGTVSKEQVVSVTGEDAQRLTVPTREYVGHRVAKQGVGDVTRKRKRERTDERDVGKRAEGIMG
jgi:hypothetical protein